MKKTVVIEGVKLEVAFHKMSQEVFVWVKGTNPCEPTTKVYKDRVYPSQASLKSLKFFEECAQEAWESWHKDC